MAAVLLYDTSADQCGEHGMLMGCAVEKKVKILVGVTHLTLLKKVVGYSYR